MLKEKDCIEILKATRQSYSSFRRYLDSFWTLAIAYDSGSQWASLATRTGKSVIRGLQTIIDPNREDVRATLNIIHKEVVGMTARVSPQRIASYAKAASGFPDDRIVSNTSNHVLERWLERCKGLETLREKDDARFVLGSSCVRRTLTRKPSTNGSQSFDLGLALCYPWEFIRDPGATSLHIERDENFIAHEKPRTVAWIKRHFGVDLTEKTDSTFGQLLDYQKQLHTARDVVGSGHTIDSKQKAVIFSEAYYKDEHWDTALFAWIDPSKSNDEINVLFHGANPFFSLPFHFFYYDRQIQAPWARGIPHLAIQGQDIYNLTWTWLLRMQQAGSGKLVIEKGTLDNPNEQLNNRLDIPIFWQRNKGAPQYPQPPHRLAAPQVNPATMNIMDRIPQWMGEALNFSDVQRGITSKRGESGQAIQMKLDAASAPIENLRRWDELEMQNLLYGALNDLTNPKHTNLNVLREHIGPDVPDENVKAMLRRPVSKAVSAIIVLPSTLRPQTPSENRDEIKTMVGAQILEPGDAQWEMMLRGVPVNSLMDGAYRKQMTEISAMMAGEEQTPVMEDDHQNHRRAIKLFVNSPTWSNLDEDTQDRVLEHAAGHYEAEQLLAMGQQQPATPGMPSPPAEAVSASGGSSGSMGSAIAVM